MRLVRFFHSFFVLILTISIFTLSVPIPFQASTNASVQKSSGADLEERLSRIESSFEKRRAELGIPGISVAIVKDGKVILSKGYGYKDFENKVPMTPDTQLAIGSASKAFTGLSVLMLQDEDKLSLDEQPRKYLPYFRINNPETDKKITVRDLMSHSSGLNRTDLAMLTGKLNREELIKVAGEAKPMAGLREKFFYQNIMFAAAGEIVTKVSGMDWEEFVPERIFAPLGMNNSTMSVKQMHNAKDYSFGYSYNFDTKETSKLPTRELGPVAPAGSINSSANDMAKWIDFILNKGKTGEKKLVSESSFEEWTKPQMNVTPNGKMSYGLGWFIQEWKDKKVLQHGGNIDGFNSMVALLPEENLGFVLLTNVSGSSLGSEMIEMVFSGLLTDSHKATAGPEQEKEVGTYLFPEAGFDVEVKIEDEKLVLKVPRQPTYTLEQVEGRRYSLTGAPGGFFITFKEGEAYLEQPQGNFTLKKKGAAEVDSVGSSKPDSQLQELIGSYSHPDNDEIKIEVKEVSGAVSLVVPGQPPYPLRKNETDKYGFETLPSNYSLVVRRGAKGDVEGVTMIQPEGEFPFNRISETIADTKTLMSGDELIAKVVDALGGEENLLKITSRKTEVEFDAVHQGVKGYGTILQKMPRSSRSETTLTALGKKIGWIKSVFDGKKGFETYSFAEKEEWTGKRLVDVTFANEFHPFLGLSEELESPPTVSMTKFEDKDAYLLKLQPKKGSPVQYTISSETFLPLKRSSFVVSSSSDVQIPVTETYSDYRKIDGVMVAFKLVVNHSAMGDLVTTIRALKHNVKISDEKFLK